MHLFTQYLRGFLRKFRGRPDHWGYSSTEVSSMYAVSSYTDFICHEVTFVHQFPRLSVTNPRTIIQINYKKLPQKLYPAVHSKFIILDLRISNPSLSNLLQHSNTQLGLRNPYNQINNLNVLKCRPPHHHSLASQQRK